MIAALSAINLRGVGVGLIKSLLAVLLIGAPLAYATARYSVGIETNLGSNCLPWAVYLIDTWHSDVSRGGLIAFRSRRMEPFYPDGTLVVKVAAGLPGDQVEVANGTLRVRDQIWGSLVHAMPGGRLAERGATLAQYARRDRVPDGHILVLGTHPRSYDSRYWGEISNDEVTGRAIALW